MPPICHPPATQLDTDACELQSARAAELGVGIELVVGGSDADGFFGPFRDALIKTPALLAEYNQLKLRLDGLDYERYTDQKGEFIERVLRDLKARPH